VQPKIAVIDGMGGGIGAQIVTQLRQEWKALTKQISQAIAMVRERAGLPAPKARTKGGGEVSGDLELARTVLQAQGKALVLVKDGR